MKKSFPVIKKSFLVNTDREQHYTIKTFHGKIAPRLALSYLYDFTQAGEMKIIGFFREYLISTGQKSYQNKSSNVEMYTVKHYYTLYSN